MCLWKTHILLQSNFSCRNSADLSRSPLAVHGGQKIPSMYKSQIIMSHASQSSSGVFKFQLLTLLPVYGYSYKYAGQGSHVSFVPG